ncbi:binding-protein-dependent transport systems inner membrane component [Thermaerobacter marianensis DSM 12885]|uniref:Binding-protein-dependent transport systems inner membrane component n=1 Tax=Thermaerobacter marianensis (strain ATCC 700841 / DSM 12885 / JCM 10246 / 7p75a) TaxID=644966 RepID=E6SMF8_THEM7|nr:ABC transporter permease [Thermaerobacter marianensis]ADU50418.1 binding-protein-dependent transport systems inner membrane component [Thermaerobacter marianensis DSM 12885]
MAEYLVRRVVQSLLVLWLVSVVTFAIIHLAPGGPIQYFLQPGLSPAAIQQQIKNLGLDRPIPVQYLDWLGDLLRGDLGHTFKGYMPVAQIIWPTFKNTLILMTTAWVLTLVIAIPWGVYNSARQYGFSDTLASLVGYAGFAMPSFWLGIILQETFALKLKWFPLSNMYTYGREGDVLDLLHHMVLPVTTLVIINLAAYLKYARASMLEVLGQDYIRTARAKGVPERRVIFRHALRNALIPVITILGLDLPFVVSGAALTEAVFNWPGMGQLFVQMAFAREYQVLMAITLIVTVVVVLGNLLADILYAVVDPRVRLTGKGVQSA